MKSILFVDDEKNILRALKRMLRHMKDEWQMEFAESGKEALQIMKANGPFDVIVSDVRMPDMDGIQLLKEVKRIAPDTIRIVLSGFAGKDFLNNVGDEIHRYLTKPTSEETLTTTIQRAFSLRETLTNDNMKKIVPQIGDLPTLPAIYTELMMEIRKPETNMGRIAKIISKDIGLTAKILQLVNSAYFGNIRRISVVDQAVNMLGVDTIKGLALTTSVFKKLGTISIEEFSLDDVWSHSLRVGNISRMIAEMQKFSKESQGQAFTAGLLHDVGRLVLASKVERKYAFILRQSNNDENIMCEIEQTVFGLTHAEVGAYMIGLWGLHDPIVEAIAYHHTPMENYFNDFSEVAVVHIADGIAEMIETDIDRLEKSKINLDYVEKLGCLHEIPRWIERARNFEL